MSRVTLVTPDKAEGRVKEIYAEIEQARGTRRGITCLFQAYALSPQVLEANWAMTKLVMGEGLVPKTLKEKVALYVARIAGCET